ncbi:MAG TPA: diacylglycerol kinase family protein [Anaerolineaceae bacterium]|jgi:diacylglycerol kinase|nr:diacylglycerol kinase family protein [Anaerolineaceae bacterium]HQJ02587.1 diacylglycerol kinase family protein [Anaerolineaceae bacterium]HQP61319.1 diacylglycerol kinase family protein [Anaerolineaceae bacterium]
MKYMTNRRLSFKYAFQGITYLLQTQPNARIHLAATSVVILISAWLNINKLEWLFLITAIGIVWLAEGFNTSLETVVNLATSEFHPLAKIAKDTAAASVLISSITALLIGIIILAPPLWTKITGWFH